MKLKSKIIKLSFLAVAITSQTAYATDILIFSNETYEQNANQMILDFDDTGGDVTIQFGSTLNEQLFWDNTATEFVFTDDLRVQGLLDVNGNTFTLDSDNTGAGANVDIVAEQGSDNNGTLRYNATTNQWEISNDGGAFSAISTGAINGTTSNTFTLDTDDTGGDVTLQFGNTLNETLTWNNASSQFDLSDDLNITGNITLTGTVDGVDVSTLNTTVTGHLDGGASKHDATEIDFEKADGSKKVIQASSDDVESALNDLDEALANSTKTLAINMNDLTVTADGTSNLANLYFGNDSANDHQYYSVKSRQAALNDLDVIVQVKLPEDFVSFANTGDLSFFYKNTGVDNTDSKIDILVEDAAGNDAFTAADGQNLFNAAWTEYTDEFDGVGFSPTAGDYIFITIKGYASKDGVTFQQPFLGEIVLSYTGANK